MEKTTWLERLSQALEEAAGPSVRDEVMQGSAGLGSSASPGRKARWVKELLARMEEQLNPADQAKVMAACHCGFPLPQIRRCQPLWEETRQVDRIIAEMQAYRREMLWRQLNGKTGLWEKVQEQPYFLSPLRDGRRVLHVSPPYHPWVTLVEDDPLVRRGHSCHCGWINGSKENVSTVFCNCGAGFYQSFWESVLGQPVEVTILDTVFQGADYCRMQITLPEDCVQA